LDRKSVELIVVDNDPAGQARAVCQGASTALPIGLHFTEEHERGISFARNKAVSTALSQGADLVAFIDDDDIPEPDWLLRLIDKERETDADIVFGTWRQDANLPKWANSGKLFRNSRHDQEGDFGLPRGVATCNVLVKRGVIEKLRSEGFVFSPEFAHTGGGDKDFFIRARKAGAIFASADKSIINRNYEDYRLTIRGLLTRGFKNGCSRIRTTRRHGTRAGVRTKGAIALLRLPVKVISLPLYVFSKALLMRHLYRLSKDAGVLYGYTGRTFRYY
jgi:glycosyltransferase involved in cell wall biosynthesis